MELYKRCRSEWERDLKERKKAAKTKSLTTKTSSSSLSSSSSSSIPEKTIVTSIATTDVVTTDSTVYTSAVEKAGVAAAELEADADAGTTYSLEEGKASVDSVFTSEEKKVIKTDEKKNKKVKKNGKVEADVTSHPHDKIYAPIKSIVKSSSMDHSSRGSISISKKIIKKSSSSHSSGSSMFKYDPVVPKSSLNKKK